MNVSTTERGTYKRCRRQHLVNSRNRWGLSRIVSSGPLALGTLVHSTLGTWIEMTKRHQALVAAGNGSTQEAAMMLLPAGSLSNVFLQYAQQTIDEAKAIYEQQTGATMSDSELAPLYESATQGRCMMDNYQSRWGSPVPAGFEIIATEQRCIVPIPGTEHTSEYVWVQHDPVNQPYVWSRELRQYNEVRYHNLEGKLDGIIRNPRDGKLYILEHKTYGQRPREDVLHTTDQFVAYHWLLLQLVSEMGMDPKKVEGVAYDGLWKRAAPPKMVDGHKGELKDLFCRKLIPHTRAELIEFEQQIADEVMEMASGPAPYKNRTSDGSCFWGCSDEQLCRAMTRGEDVEWLLRRNYRKKEPDEDMDTEREPA